jgi:hypothetical protein
MTPFPVGYSSASPIGDVRYQPQVSCASDQPFVEAQVRSFRDAKHAFEGVSRIHRHPVFAQSVRGMTTKE